ncbi:hypothetical protein Patl1_04070 [Pistacia atlantica]|uniref:Uncharacterized protein n=1 Tax=Pistacia atlantica TaxID=434234 RepID=A0ACC1BQC0_9ROSI|nr:hypothetical protein Patl1_04070 [Pistacia atlantica]
MVFGMIIGYLVFTTRKPQRLVRIVVGGHCQKVRRPNKRHCGRKEYFLQVQCRVLAFDSMELKHLGKSVNLAYDEPCPFPAIWRSKINCVVNGCQSGYQLTVTIK